MEKDIVSILLQYIREEDGDLQMTSLSILLELACIGRKNNKNIKIR